MSGAILFDGDQTRELGTLAEKPSRLAQDQLLWVDVKRGDTGQAEEVAAVLGVDDETTRHLAEPQDHASFRDRGRYLHVTAFAPRLDEGGELHPVECVVGESWVVTAHDLEVPVLEEFAARVSGSGETGALDGPGFLAALLEWVLGSYTEVFEDIEEQLEGFDVQAMRGRGGDQDIETLVGLRRHVGQLRRALAAHRSALVALTHPELEALGDNASSDRFVSLFARFESTLQEARDAREAIVGSFDVLIARDGHETNRTIKVLTLVSVFLFTGSLIAGVMGMNFRLGIYDETRVFWVVVAAILVVAPATLGIAKLRRWI